MSTQELTQAIEKKDFVSAQQHVEREIMQRISERMDLVRETITRNLFKAGMTEPKIIPDKDKKGNGVQVNYMKKVEDDEDCFYIDKLNNLTKQAKPIGSK